MRYETWSEIDVVFLHHNSQENPRRLITSPRVVTTNNLQCFAETSEIKCLLSVLKSSDNVSWYCSLCYHLNTTLCTSWSWKSDLLDNIRSMSHRSIMRDRDSKEFVSTILRISHLITLRNDITFTIIWLIYKGNADAYARSIHAHRWHMECMREHITTPYNFSY